MKKIPGCSSALSPRLRRLSRRGPRILSCSVLAAVAFLPKTGLAAILDQYTFGTGAQSILTPTTVDGNVSATSITNDSGLSLDLSNQAVIPSSGDYLRTTDNAVDTTVAAAKAANADFQFTLTANSGQILNLSSFTFDAMRGGASTGRGFAVYSSVDGFTTTLLSGDVPTVRPTLTSYTINLTGTPYQGLSSITFKIYSYAPAAGSSVDYDTFTVNGTTGLKNFNGYTFKGTTNGNWDTTTANWSGLGTKYVDGTSSSNVLFDDSSSTGTVNVTPAALNPNAITFNNSTARNYTIGGSALNVATTISKLGSGTSTFNNTVTAATTVINAGTLGVGANGTLNAGALTVAGGGTLSVAGNLNATSGTVSGSMTGAGTFTKTGTGSLEIAGSSAFAGVTNVNGGTLLVSGSLSGGSIVVGGGYLLVNGSATGTPITANSGTVGGVGTLGSVIMNSGTLLAPGSTTSATTNFGTLTLNGALTMSGGTYAVEMANSFVGLYDQVVTSQLKLNGPVALTLDFSQYEPFDLDTFTIIDGSNAVLFGNASSRFTFNGTLLNQGDTFIASSGPYTEKFQIDYAGNDGNDVVLTALEPAVVPEPCSFAFLSSAVGLLGMARMRRRI